MKILAAYFEGDTNLFPEPDDGSSEKAAFRIANWETIGTLSSAEKTYQDKHIDDWDPKWVKFCKDTYKHYKHYNQNRFGIWGILVT